MNNLGMRKKLLLMFLGVSVIPIVAIAILATRSSMGSLKEATFDKVMMYGELTEDRIETYMSEKLIQGQSLSDMEFISNSLSTYNQHGKDSEEWRKAYAELESYMEVYTERYGLSSIYLTDVTGQGIYGSGEYKDKIEGSDYSGRDYFQRAIAGEQNISDFGYSDILEDYYIALATPVEDGDGKIIGLVNGYLPVDLIEEMIQMNVGILGDSGDAYLIDGTGLLYTDTLLGEYSSGAAFQKQISTKAKESLEKAIESGDQDFQDVGVYDDYLGNSVLGSYMVVESIYSEGNPLGLIIELDESEALRSGIILRNALITIVVVILLMGLAVALLIANMITRPLKIAVEELNHLTLESKLPDDLLDRKDELGEMARGVDKVIGTIKNTVTKVVEASREVTEESEQLSESSEQVSRGTDEVTKTIEEIAEGASDQANDTENVSTSIQHMSKLMEEDLEYVNMVSEAMQKVSNENREGTKTLRELTEKAKENEEASNLVYTSIMSNNESAEKIEGASSMIQNIADQTNLLALNAAIEAARAGEAGKGFAVVAEEIRKLAEQSSEFTSDIRDVISELKLKSGDAVSAMKSTNEIVEKQTENVHETEKRFQSIAEAIDLADDVIEKLSKSSRDMSQEKDKVLDLIQNLSAISEENAAGTQEVSASMQEQYAMIQEIASSGKRLEHISKELDELTKQF